MVAFKPINTVSRDDLVASRDGVEGVLGDGIRIKASISIVVLGGRGGERSGLSV